MTSILLAPPVLYPVSPGPPLGVAGIEVLADDVFVLVTRVVALLVVGVGTEVVEVVMTAVPGTH